MALTKITSTVTNTIDISKALVVADDGAVTQTLRDFIQSSIATEAASLTVSYTAADTAQFNQLMNTSIPAAYYTKVQIDALLTTVNNNIYASVPIGTVLLYSGSTPPTGFLIANGAVIAQATYPQLYSVVGQIYQATASYNTATHFRIPDLVGRGAIGAGTAVGDVTAVGKVLGEAGGAEKVAMSIAELPAHNHVVTDSGNAFMVYADGGQAVGGILAAGDNASNIGHAYRVTSLNTGSGQAHNNMQPYAVLNYIIRVL